MYRDVFRADRARRKSVFFIARFEFIYLAITAVLTSLMLSILIPSMVDSINFVAYTCVGCIIASTAGIYILKSVRNYPGVEESFYKVPAFCLSYGILLLILVLARIPYSRLLLITVFTVNIIMSFIIHAALHKYMKHCIGVVSAGEYAKLIEIPGVDWKLLENPSEDLGDVDSVSVDLRSDLSDEWERFLASLALTGVPVYHTKHLAESLTGKVEIERISENSFGTLSPLYAYMNVKHALDWAFAILAIIALIPLLIVIAIIIKIDSPGPVIFKQIRIGYQGKPFRVYKFRTMAVAKFNQSQVVRDDAITKSGDNRITGIGRFLRHSRLDELPQLINVLKGEMSWIGPRPEADILSRWYETEIPFYRYRHIVRPGITGWAQVHQGHVADVDQVREKLHFDFYYIKNFSLWIDVIVVVRTVRTMLTGFGSR